MTELLTDTGLYDTKPDGVIPGPPVHPFEVFCSQVENLERWALGVLSSEGHIDAASLRQWLSCMNNMETHALNYLSMFPGRRCWSDSAVLSLIVFDARRIYTENRFGIRELTPEEKQDAEDFERLLKEVEESE